MVDFLADARNDTIEDFLRLAGVAVDIVRGGLEEAKREEGGRIVEGS